MVSAWDGMTFVAEMNNVDRADSHAVRAAEFADIQVRAHAYSVALLGEVALLAPYGDACATAVSAIAEAARQYGFAAAYYALIYENWPRVDYFDEVSEHVDAGFAAGDRALDHMHLCGIAQIS